MEKRSVSCNWTAYSGPEDLSSDYQELIEQARMAVNNSYAPYSNFKVGAAARMEDQSIITGSNMENASFPLCICAEKSCITNSENQKHGMIMQAIAITAKHPTKPIDHPVSPCGSCRQVMVEKEQRQGQKMKVLLFGETGAVWVFDSAVAFLPLPFDGSAL